MTWIYLSHVLGEGTPLYGGRGQVLLQRSRSMGAGDTANSSDLSLPAHSGTHVDAPRHFDPAGATLDCFPAEYWQAARCWLLDVPCQPGEMLLRSRWDAAFESVPEDCDLLLLRTGAEAWRSDRPALYAEQGPGVGADLAQWLRRHRRLKFLGMDFISVSSFAHREAGREAHRALLATHDSGAAPILPIEDMTMARLEQAPRSAWIVPLRYSDADGAPVTVLAEL